VFEEPVRERKGKNDSRQHRYKDMENRDMEGVKSLLGSDVLIGRVVLGELEGDVEHVEAEERHPGRSVGLSKDATGGKRLGSVEGSDVVESEETSLEDVVSASVLSVNPPAKQATRRSVRRVPRAMTGSSKAETYQVKLMSSFWKTLSKKSRSSRPNSFRSILKTRNVAQAWTGGLTSLKFHSYAGSAPSGFMYHSRVIRSSCFFENAGSIIASGMQWKAVSQAAERRVDNQYPVRLSLDSKRNGLTEERVLPLVGHREDVGDMHVLPFL
jgi:hypothetical protein